VWLDDKKLKNLAQWSSVIMSIIYSISSYGHKMLCYSSYSVSGWFSW